MTADTTNAIESIWRRLRRAAADKKDPARTLHFATVDTDGKPQSRMVVLRAVDMETRTLRFFTDWASGKCAELKDNSNTALTLWDPVLRLQVRLSALGRVTTMPNPNEIGVVLDTHERALYGLVPEPGTVIEGSGEFQLGDRLRFATVDCVVTQLDALWLSRPKHRRLSAAWTQGRWDSYWVVP